MKKILIALFSALATVAIAETDYIAMPRIEAIVSGEEAIVLNASSSDIGVATATSVAASGAVSGSTLGITAGTFTVVSTTQLVFIASGVTNVLDTDITH